MVIHSAASAKGLGFNSAVAQAYLKFNARASTLAGKQAMRCTLQQTMIVQCSVECRLGIR